MWCQRDHFDWTHWCRRSRKRQFATVFEPHLGICDVDKVRRAKAVNGGQAKKDILGGTTCIGNEGEIRVNRGKLSSTPGDTIKQELGTDDVLESPHMTLSITQHKKTTHPVSAKRGGL